jgi:aminoglycoside phosphotransferase family enzyme
MDLDAGGHSELAADFLTAYLSEWRVIAGVEDQSLFLYFKAYRANVRLKVALMFWEKQKTDASKQSARVYWDLLGSYLARLDNGISFDTT